MKSNVNLCVTLKTHLFSSVLLTLNHPYTGVLRRNGLDHFDFVETLRICSCKRNPHVFSGHYITITRRDDGSYRPNLRAMKDCHSLNSAEEYATGVYKELIKALSGLVEKNGN